MPPTSNAQYKPVRRGGKLSFVATAELQAYKRTMGNLFYKNPRFFMDLLKKIQSWTDNGIFLEVKATFFFERARIITLKNTAKKLDVSNRIKSLHDGLAELLNCDDCHFFKISAEKRLTLANQPEGVVVEILPYFCDL